MQSTYSSIIHSTSSLSRNELIHEYFNAGYTYNEIILILFHKHHMIISHRQLTRILRSLGLRRYERTYHEEMITALQSEINGSGCCLGYRSMTQRLRNRHGLVMPRSVVLNFQRLLDPEGVSARRCNRLQRRSYINKGPNFLIHIDGYDKLKKYGFAIHGAICGYSRRILWLRVANTNNDPAVVASYFMSYVKEIKGVPRCVRMDAGTENVLIEDIQLAFRSQHTDDMADEKSIVIGSSKSNQGPGKILLHTTDLDNLQVEWNQHNVRSQRDGTDSGKPDIMFHLPELYDTVDYKVTVDLDDVDNILNEWCTNPMPFGCSEDIATILSERMRQIGLKMPSTFQEGIELYEKLNEVLD